MPRWPLAALTLLLACDKNATTTPPVTAPPPATTPATDTLASTRRQDVADDLHGVRVPDPYRWLEDVKSPDVQAWMKKRDDEARAALAALPLRSAFEKRFRELYYIDAISPPSREGKRYFYSRRHADREKTVHYVREGEKGAEQVLLDPNTLSADGSISVSGLVPSKGGRYLAYMLSKNNSDDATLYVRDLDTGKELTQDTIPGARYAWPQWSPDASGFYYTGLPVDPGIDPKDLPGRAEIRFHKLGTDWKTDAVIHPPLGDSTKFLFSGMSRDGRWLFVTISNAARSEVYFRDLKAPPPAAAKEAQASPTLAAGFTPLAVGRDAHYYAGAFKNKIYLFSDDGAPRGQLFVVDPKKPAREHWKLLVPERKDSTLEGFQIVGGHLSLTYQRDVVNYVEVRKLDGSLLREVPLPGLGSSSGLFGREDEDEAYFSFTSFIQMPQIFKTSVKTGKTELWETIKYPADVSQMTAEQVRFTSKDGTSVPMFLIRRKDTPRTGDNPTLLTGYGGFGVSLSPGFSTAAVAWLEHGGVMAIPNLRGGGEFGEDWHKAGMLERKQNVFDDFIAAAEFLVREKYTRPDRLAISGGSNGGLLVGAAMTQRPDLFRAVVCSVPLLDMVRYHKFGTGQTWIEEYGSADDPAQFKFLHAYSPYHQIREGAKYPALLMMSADSDDRVDPLHARKFAAGVAWATRSGHPVLLRIERNAGHGGADMVKAAVAESADEYAFLAAQLGVTQ